MERDTADALSEREIRERLFGMKPPDTHTPSEFFLGPNADNIETLQDMISIVLEDHAKSRRDYAPKDPNMVKPGIVGNGSQAATRNAMVDNLKVLTRDLRGSIPLSSYRNQSHMYWDITMPGVAGYFAGLLYNQNNVAAEASPVTTSLEISVIRDLCRMIGFDPRGTPEPWGHIAAGGTVANTESMWAARNLKYQAAAIAHAIRNDADLKPAEKLAIRKPDGSWAHLLDLTRWELVNLGTDEVLDLTQRMIRETGISGEAVKEAVDRYSLQAMGVAEFNHEVLCGEVKPTPAIMVPATAHYSWEKAVTILGLGHNALRWIPVDLEGRMILSELKRELDICQAERRPVVQVVSVMGSTGESAVDPLSDILDLRAQFAGLGLTFALHADAAWGGYFASMLREPFETEIRLVDGEKPKPVPPDGEETGFDDAPQEAMSPYVRQQFDRLGEVDSITLDPHKSGFIPYSAGAICYRNREMATLIAHTSPVVYHDGNAPTVGMNGIEGSRPGAAACGVALSHITIPTNKLGYGRLLGRCMFNAKRYYAAVTTMAAPDDDFIVVPMQRLPAERDGGTAQEIADQKALIATKFVGHENDDLLKALADPALKRLFRALGPDLTVFAYAFNFKVGGVVNRDLDLMNEFNNTLFAQMSIEERAKSGRLPLQQMFVTGSEFDASKYGLPFMQDFARRAGLDYSGSQGIRYLISTMQNPFVSSTEKGNFIPTLIKALAYEIKKARGHIVQKYNLEAEGS